MRPTESIRPNNTPELKDTIILTVPGSSQIKEGVLLQVTVKAGSKQQKVEIDDDRLLFFLRSPPTDNQANKELLKMLVRLTGISSSQIQIISGATSKHKTILLKNTSLNNININKFIQ